MSAVVPPRARTTGLRVGYVVKAFPQLSESFVENELRVLAARGVHVEVASLLAPRPDLRGPTELADERLHVLPRSPRLAVALARWALLRPRVVARATRRAVRERSMTMLRGVPEGAWIASTFRRAGIGQLHAHFATDAASAAMVAAELLGVPWSFTIHARELYLRTSGLWAKCQAADAVVTVCDYNVEQLREACDGQLPVQLHVIHCGVDLDRFPPRSEAPSRDGFHLVSVGRLVPKKGFGDLIDAVALLAADGMDVTLDIIGSGDLADDLRTRIDRHGLAGRVRLRGALLPSEVARAVRGADVFVLANVIAPDGDRDSMPVVTKEAMASAVPVVTTDTVANPEMVDEHVGRLVPPHDPEALAAAIRDLAALSPAERHALGSAGRRRVEQRFSLASETERLHAVLDALA